MSGLAGVTTSDTRPRAGADLDRRPGTTAADHQPEGVDRRIAPVVRGRGGGLANCESGGVDSTATAWAVAGRGGPASSTAAETATAIASVASRFAAARARSDDVILPAVGTGRCGGVIRHGRNVRAIFAIARVRCVNSP